FRLRHADDGHGFVANVHDLADDRRVLTEPARPVVVADDRHQTVRPALARYGVVRRAERASQCGLDAEQREVVARHALALNLFEPAVDLESGIIDPGEGRQADERLRLVAEALEARVRRRAP